jgi:hypothetical protein
VHIRRHGFRAVYSISLLHLDSRSRRWVYRHRCHGTNETPTRTDLQVDPFWLKPLPNKWSMRQIVDLYVDKNDHIWVLNRRSDARPDELGAMTTPPRTECCVLGPEVLEFDQAGNIVRSWSGPTCGGIWSTTDPPCGTVYNLTLSHDKEQKYVSIADGTNNMVWIHERKTGKQVGSFGGNGRYAGQLHWIDSVMVDSKGNFYTGEVEDGKRIQKFVLQNPAAFQ